MHLAETGSTNTLAAAEAARRWSPGHAEPIVVSADRQTAGRGRDGRSWASPIGGAYLSVAYPWPRAKIDRAAMAPLAAALAIRAAVLDITDLAGDRLRIKWPNDLLIDDAKAAGVLCERQVMGDAASSDRPATDRDAVIVGIGVNVRGGVESLGPVRVPATTLELITGHAFDPGVIVDAIVGQLVHRLDRLVRSGWTDDNHHALNAALAYRDQPVAFVAGGESRTGTLLGVTPDGRALVRRLEQDQPTPLAAGDIDRLTPAET
ncbi:MAG: biotin--[acetyl-CoA-carboxylase] ligase [Planctomycetota bacterium]